MVVVKVKADVTDMILVSDQGTDKDSLLVRVQWQAAERLPWKKKNVVVTGTDVPSVLRAAATAIETAAATPAKTP